VCDGNYLDTLAKDTVDDEEREPTQQEASGVADVRRRGFRPLGNQVDGSKQRRFALECVKDSNATKAPSC
jgi:hypothetical protein